MPTGTIEDAKRLSLKRDGTTYVPGAVSADLVMQFRQLADDAYEIIKQPEAAPPEQRELAQEVARSSAAWGGIPVHHVVSLSSDKQKAADIVAGVVSVLAELIAIRTGYSANFKPELSYIRRHKDTSTYAPWHFDAFAAGTIAHDPVYNAWLPFVPVGKEKPGLEFIPGTSGDMRAERYDKFTDGYPSESWIAARSANRVCVPMEPGDVAIFDHYTLHQTQVASFPNYVRTSAEMRFSLKGMPKLPLLKRLANAFHA